MHVTPVAEPCRNFQILGIGAFTDPVDRREKVVLANFAAGGTGNLVIIDPDTGEGEDITLPGDSGAWAVHNWHDEKLLIGTCGTYGYLHCLDLASRAWAEPLRDEGETYIWNLCVGSDGLIYGGTYPGCVLLRYDPSAHRLDNLGRVSDTPENLYSRMVYGGVPGHILVSCGTADPHLSLYDIDEGTWRRFGELGASVAGVGDGFICTDVAGESLCYDSTSFDRLDEDWRGKLSGPPAPPNRFGGMRMHIPLTAGGWLVNRGQEYYLDDGSEQTPTLHPIPATAPATHILTLIADDAGTLWGAAGFGQTIFRYDPVTGQAWNSQVVTDNSGEVYGMAFTRDRLYLATYSGGDHVVYDPAAPWDQLGNVNPVTLESVSPRGLIRPYGKSVVGPDGNVWSGWMAAYGVYGGGLSRVDVDDHAMTCWYDPVREQAVSGVAASDRYLYFVTCGDANGLAAREVEPHFVVWDCDAGQIVKQERFARGTRLGCVAATADRVIVAVDERLQCYDDAGDASASIHMPAAIRYLAPLPDGRLAAFSQDHLWLVAPGGDEPVVDGGQMPGRVDNLASTPHGLFLSAGRQLYRLTF